MSVQQRTNRTDRSPVCTDAPAGLWAGAQVVPITLHGLGFNTTAFANSDTHAYNVTALTDLTTVEAVRMLCDRDIIAEEYATALLQKAHEWECINTWADIDPKQVSQAARLLHRRM